MAIEERRPDPDALLRRVRAEEQRKSRAKLKVFFGYAPGVGKTYTMLESAQRLKAEGVEIAIGCVETHGRPETAALIEGLDVLPRRQITHRGTHLTEFDIDLARAKKPRIVLLDELAHTNAPGSRHPKRWQDVVELLDAGMDVHTTLNVQHIESLNDVIAKITTVRVRETVPDAILDRADEIELVDLPPDELLIRLQEGKVYVPEQARQAMDHFFRRGNLLALREIALRITADRVDADVRAYRVPHTKVVRGPMTVPWMDYLQTVVLVGIATAFSLAGRSVLALPDIVTFYLLVIMIVAFRFGRAASIAAAALSVAAYNFFFVPPLFAFSVGDARHFLTFAIMFIVGLTVSSLMGRIRRQEQDARVREERTAALYSLTRELATVLSDEEAAQVTARHAAETFGADAGVLLHKSSGALALKGMSRPGLHLAEQELSVARWASEHGRLAGQGTDTLPGCRVMCVPLQSGPKTLGVLVLRSASSKVLEIERRAFLDAFARQATLAVERAQLREEAKASALRATAEEMRSSLLSAVSHDLRTPLAAITGAGTALRDEEGRLGKADRADLLDTICSDSERMERLVGNLLDMMRLECGGLALKREWVPLEEVVGSALTRLDARLSDRNVTIDLPDGLPLICVDPVLFEQVFVNLLDNAIKYSPAASAIDVRARARQGVLDVEVTDRGPGLPPGDPSVVFEKFWRGTHPGVGGVGLGLPICRGIVQAHGGSIAAEHGANGGACFRILLPLQQAPSSTMTDGDNRPAAEGPAS